MPISGRPVIGIVRLPLSSLPPERTVSVWLPLSPVSYADSATTSDLQQRMGTRRKQCGELRLEVTYTPFAEDDNVDSGYGSEGDAITEILKEQVRMVGGGRDHRDARGTVTAERR